MLKARVAVVALVVAAAFGAGLLLAGGSETPSADAEPTSKVEAIDVSDRAVDVPSVSAVRLPQLRDEPKPDTTAPTPGGGASAGTAAGSTSSTPSTGATGGSTSATPSTGTSSGSTGGTTQAPKPDTGSTGSTGGGAEEGSTGS